MTMQSFLFYSRDCHCRDTFAATNRAEAFVCRRFNADAEFTQANRIRNCFSHSWNVRRDLWRFCDQRRVHVQRPRMNFAQQSCHSPQNLDAANPANRFVRVREMMADVSFADCTQQCVRNRVANHIGVRMAFQPAIVRNLDAAQDQFPAGREPVRVITVSAPDRAHSFKSITPFDATMLYLSFMSARGFRSTVPPAVSTRIHPAAMSHRLMPCSM